MAEVVGAILVRADRLLLGLRAPHKSYPGCWDVFGGHLEAGETPSQALGRELREELDLTNVAATLIESLHFEHPSEGPSLLHMFRAEAWDGEPRIADAEHVELRWFRSEEAQALVNLPDPEYRRIFADLSLP